MKCITRQGPLWDQNYNYNGLGMSFPTEPVSLHSSEIQATLSKMNALYSLLTAKSVTNTVSEMQRNQIKTQVCAGSRGLTNVLCPDP